MRILTLLFVLFCTVPAFAQFAPQAGQSGTTAVHRYSGSVSRWATGCSIIRGLQHIAQPSLGYTSIGDSSLVTGMADGSVVSLGDSGIAVVTFNAPIADAPGADIAVFENGFLNPTEGGEAFLEIAFVEISSDGTNFFRFPATSDTQDTAQIPGAGTYMDAKKLNNLAGKYAATYGTPFDFSELAGTSGLDLSNITHVRIVDAIGSIGAHACVDAVGHKINDPYPTPFPSGGFDLDAIAVLHGTNPNAIASPAINGFRIFPNPATAFLNIHCVDKAVEPYSARLTNVMGEIVLKRDDIEGTAMLSVESLPPGIYNLHVQSTNGSSCTQRIVLQ